MSRYSEGNDFEDILQRLLANVDEDVDIRQGSIIYDALAPAAAELAQCYIALDVFTDQTYLLNAVGENLDNRAYDYGIYRISATSAIRLIEIYDINNDVMDVDIDTRFAVPNDYGGYVYRIIEKIENGKYKAECETAGTIGNSYTGELLPVTSINNLGTVNISTIIKPGEDEETDDDLKSRVIVKINQQAFGGNKADYIRFVDEIDGVSKCKVFPIWDGGGTVKVAILASGDTIPDSSFVNEVQDIIDPIPNQGQGLGIAPIGHTVTVAAPTQVDINISMTITMETGYSKSQAAPQIGKLITDYIKNIQAQWQNKDSLVVRQAQLIALALSVPHVENVTLVKINNVSADYVITITASNISFPVLSGVDIQ